jgi:aminopeptidase 2
MASERVLLPSAVTPSHYALTLTPDLEKLTFLGSVDINVAVHEADVTSVTVHSKEIQITTVSFKSADGDSSFKLVGINYNLELTTVSFLFDKALPVGQGVLSIEYAGILNGDMSGFYRSYYVDADGVRKVIAIISTCVYIM